MKKKEKKKEWLFALRNCSHSNGGIWAKSMRNTGHCLHSDGRFREKIISNTGQGERHKTSCPGILFDMVTVRVHLTRRKYFYGIQSYSPLKNTC